MFNLNIRPFDYSDPWQIPLTDRLHTLAKGKIRIAYFYEEPNNSTFRYRAYNMCQALNHGNDDSFSASYFFISDLGMVNIIAELADMLVVCRSRYCNNIGHLISIFHAKGKRVLFDIDDLIFDTEYTHLILNSLDQNLALSQTWDHMFAYIARMGETLKLCDGALTTNLYLANKISEFSGLQAKVIPNFINKEQLDISDAVYNRKVSSSFFSEGKITFGYFSGSPSHNLDYAMIVPAMEQILSENPNTALLVVGYIDIGHTLSRFGDRVARQPFHDYVNLQQLIGSVEFNLMPLQNNVFTSCKSELKYFEAAIVGTLSIASPSYTYSMAIQDGENGYISKSHQWTNKIQTAINGIARYKEMAIRARDDAYNKYAWCNQKENILKALNLL